MVRLVASVFVIVCVFVLPMLWITKLRKEKNGRKWLWAFWVWIFFITASFYLFLWLIGCV